MPKICEFSGLLCAAALALPTMLMPVAAHADDALVDALIGGKVSGNFRLRYESVDVRSATIEDASALTLRSRLGYETAPFYGFTALLELEDTLVVGGVDNYAPESTDAAKAASATAAVRTNPYTYAAIVDPEQTEINRAYLRYRGISKFERRRRPAAHLTRQSTFRWQRRLAPERADLRRLYREVRRCGGLEFLLRLHRPG